MNAEDAEDAEKDRKKKAGSVAVYASPMRPHPRIRKTIKWGGLALAACFLIAWWVTPWYSVSYGSSTGIGASMSSGQATFVFSDNPVLADGELDFASASHGFAMASSFRVVVDRDVQAIAIPFWFLVLLTAIPSALAWRLDTLARRREKLGSCPSCGYDRTGLAPSSPCPECGKECAATVPPPASG